MKETMKSAIARAMEKQTDAVEPAALYKSIGAQRPGGLYCHAPQSGGRRQADRHQKGQAALSAFFRSDAG